MPMKIFHFTRFKVIIFVFVGLPALAVALAVLALMADPCAIQAADPESYPELWSPDNDAQKTCLEFVKCTESKKSFSRCYWQAIVGK